MTYAGTPFDLSGRVALVTGGSKGLGLSIARILAEAGAGVFVCARHGAELQAAAQSIGEGLPARVEWMEADLTRRDQAEKVAEAAGSRMGGVDILVSNAGGNVPERIEEISDDTWDELQQLHLSTAMRLTRALAPGMKARHWGRIIYVSSIMAFTSTEGRSAYSSVKAGLVGLARAVAMDLGPFGITANCLVPGPILTDLPKRVLTEDQRRQFANRTALFRYGEPSEVASPTLLLASEAGSYITGSALVVDGGALAKML